LFVDNERKLLPAFAHRKGTKKIEKSLSLSLSLSSLTCVRLLEAPAQMKLKLRPQRREREKGFYLLTMPSDKKREERKGREIRKAINF
jgi:hypothetical protein